MAGKELARLFTHVPGATRMGAALKWRPGGLRNNVLLNEDRDSPLKCVEACRDGSVRFTFERPDQRTKAILARLLEIEGERSLLSSLLLLSSPLPSPALLVSRLFTHTAPTRQARLDKRSTSRTWRFAGAESWSQHRHRLGPWQWSRRLRRGRRPQRAWTQGPEQEISFPSSVGRSRRREHRRQGCSFIISTSIGLVFLSRSLPAHLSGAAGSRPKGSTSKTWKG